VFLARTALRGLTTGAFGVVASSVRNATKFREVHRAKRLALREPERSSGIRLAVDRVWASRGPVRQKAQIPVRSEGDG
jgi:hypothetical protein